MLEPAVTWDGVVWVGGHPQLPSHLHCRLDALDCVIQPDLVVLLELLSLGYLLQGNNFSARHSMEVFRWTPKK